MDHSLKSKFFSILEKEKQHFSKDLFHYLSYMFNSYGDLESKGLIDDKTLEFNLSLYLELIKNQLKEPLNFGNFHQREYTPIDFEALSKHLFEPFINKETSTVSGEKNLQEIERHIQNGENVILLANHQAEADPTILTLMVEQNHPCIPNNFLAVAGARVTTDPMTVPFTRGQNLICVYSKKYFNLYPEQKNQMQRHNSASMLALKQQLDVGGKCVYVAPSGGRDRFCENGKLSPAAFNPDSIELMRVIGKKTNTPTHYYPVALFTYDILPPPKKVKKEIGEERKMCHCSVHINFGEKVTLVEPTAEQRKHKDLFRKEQARSVHGRVVKLYEEITN